MSLLLDDPIRRRLDTLLLSCIECGLCLPHCATYLATGNEVDSPRGRLLLLGELARQDGATIEPTTAAALSRCLGCHSCETACPSGIPSELLDKGRELTAASSGLNGLLTPQSLPLLATAGDLAENAAWALAGPSWRRRLGNGLPPVARLVRLLGSRPSSAATDQELIGLLDPLTGKQTKVGSHDATPANRGSVTLFTGCANRAFMPGPQRRLIDLLTIAGWKVEVPAGQDCCGALESHVGKTEQANSRLANSLSALDDSLSNTGRVVVEAAGCGLALTEADLPKNSEVVDAVVMLAECNFPPLRPVPLRVVYHDPCHARHGQGIVEEPRNLLDRIPELVRLDPEEADVCCGSGGGYALVHPELSEVMGRRKADMLTSTDADLIVTSNPGCLGQIRDALMSVDDDRLIIPLSDLLWYAAQPDA